ncbi:SHOCT domain-containing protein [Halorubrum laminariae]|uniref:SHOCT domain-containing protein n=1 Tax=Halorubrum laminariae TaxID=1433523 RepID=A0ABD6C1W7_9EURY|nr:SHOCT domain-containing protein [Halorubrum laminariae]
MTGLLRRIAWNLRHRWRRVFALLVLGGGVAAPLVSGVWWTLPLVWFFGLFVALPVLHTLTKPLPDATDGARNADAESPDPALDALRERYARGEIGDEEFERKLDRLLETEDAETADGVRSTDNDLTDRVRDGIRREMERARE